MTTIPLFRAHANATDVCREIGLVCESGYLNEGLQVNALELELERRFDCGGRAALLNSCTSAIQLALKLAGVGPGDAVITPSMTCVATNVPIINAGADIVWADVDPSTGCIDPQDVRALLQKSRNVKAIICVNWAGNVCDLDALGEIAREFDVRLVQDAAHSFGATWHGRDISHWADFTCFSFQAIKHFTTGDGGMLVCKDREDASRARRLRWFGLDRDAAKDHAGDWKGQQWDVDIAEVGSKLNMNNIAAAIGIANLREIDRILRTHRSNASRYDELFAGTCVRPLTLCGKSAQESSHWVYTVRADERIRDDVMRELNESGIKAGLVHVPNHNYTCFSRFMRRLPGTDAFAATQFSLPCGWWVTTEQVDSTAITVTQKFARLR